jgi:hypothetical protein
VFEKVTSNYISKCKNPFYIGLKISVCYMQGEKVDSLDIGYS